MLGIFDIKTALRDASSDERSKITEICWKFASENLSKTHNDLLKTFSEPPEDSLQPRNSTHGIFQKQPSVCSTLPERNLVGPSMIAVANNDIIGARSTYNNMAVQIYMTDDYILLKQDMKEVSEAN